MHLPSRSARCGFPIARDDRSAGHLLPSEESASFLLWAWPQVLGWPCTLNWLFSPVVGNSTYPGDLWGIDSRGDLLIVETKLDRAGRPQDPLVDFVGYGSSKRTRELWTSVSLQARWHRLVEKEETFIREHSSRVDALARLCGTYPGVLPYSQHRDTVWRWQGLFRRRILPRFESGQYRRAIERGLRSRSEHDRPPTFIGVIATVVQTPPRLSRRGELSFRSLASKVGRSRVLLRALKVEPDHSNSIHLRSWTMPNVNGRGDR